MDETRWRRVRELFERSLRLDHAERADYLDSACGDDRPLRDEVESLLRHEGLSEDLVLDIVDRAMVKAGSPPSTRSPGSTPAGRTSGTWRERLSLSLAPRHLRGVRFWWVYVLACLLALYALGGSVYWNTTVGDTVSPGFTFMPNLQVRSVFSYAARNASLEAFDRVVALDGEAVTDVHDLGRRLQERGPGDEVSMRFERRGASEFEARLETEAGGPSLWSSLVLLRGTVWVLSGLLLFWFHPGRPASWAFLLATLTVGLPAMVPLPDYYGGRYLPLPHPLGRGWSVAVEGFIAPACLTFFLVFPSPLALLARRRWLVPALFAPASLWALLFLPTYPWYPGRAGWEALALGSYTVLVALTPLAVLTSIGILVWRSRQPRSPRQAAQLQVLVLASALSFPVPVAAYAAGTAWPVIQLELFDLYSVALNVPLLVFPPLVAYAIARHDLFGIDRLVARTAAYSVAVLLVGLLYAGAVVLLPSLLAPRALAAQPVLMAATIVAALAVLRPLRDRVLRLVEHRLEPGIDADSRARSLREALRALSREELPRALHDVERLIERDFGVEWAAFFVQGDDDSWHRAAEDPATEIGQPPSIEEPGGERRVPLRHAQTELGILALGPLRHGHLRRAEDDEVLQTLAREAARALRRPRRGQEIGGYHVDRLLGSGGMGNVYLARRHGAGGFSKRVALKELLPDKAEDAEMVRRFLDEARLAAGLEHPNIVSLYDLGESEHGYFIAMEYVPGMDLSTLLRRLEEERALLPLPTTLHVVTSVCLALDCAHGALDEAGRPLGLVHRDVTPQNVLLSETGEVKLADFGVAQLTYGRARSGSLVGKAAYMAPEQLRGERVDHRVDLFAAGLLLYELCTGTHPFRRPGREATWRAILRGDYLSPEELRPSLPASLSRLVASALEPRVERRLSSAAEMAESLQGIAAPDLRTPRHLGAFVRRLARSEGLLSGLHADDGGHLGDRSRTLGPDSLR